MREFKFRAWDLRDIEQGEPKMFYFDFEFAYQNMKCGYVMQYTGLKDKNGKEIYEGDIIKFFKDMVFEVVFKKAAFGYVLFGDFHWLVNFDKNDLEVVGNIHETPELLQAN